jgi:hypothetical protein
MGLTQPEWACINLTSFEIKGQTASIQKSFISLTVSPCVNGTNAAITCASPAGIDFVLGNTMFTIALMSTYFDEDEFEISPVKHDIT